MKQSEPTSQIASRPVGVAHIHHLKHQLGMRVAATGLKNGIRALHNASRKFTVAEKAGRFIKTKRASSRFFKACRDAELRRADVLTRRYEQAEVKKLKRLVRMASLQAIRWATARKRGIDAGLKYDRDEINGKRYEVYKYPAEMPVAQRARYLAGGMFWKRGALVEVLGGTDSLRVPWGSNSVRVAQDRKRMREIQRYIQRLHKKLRKQGVPVEAADGMTSQLFRIKTELVKKFNRNLSPEYVKSLIYRRKQTKS